MDAKVAQAIEILQQNHFKITKQRQTLIEIMSQHENNYVDVTQVDSQMRANYPKMSHNTVYRNLKEFEQIGLVEQIIKDEHAQVKYQCDVTQQHHHHFICTNCGKVEEVEMCPLDFFERQLPDYEISGHRFELYGLCADCAKRAHTV
ncbi:transcriptional repressor [Pediococcus ethanolidurans]|uniref:Fur family transcriptional regulator n=1 Tax=Pediococcus ethanolidurans TaxID=319653 RepID=UPI0021E83346|nr:transcriptional repressor [Pediococcus ethanolidurans]MCV3314847.1 transcriptional repressor [Pediococcus ethanolidurans]